MVIDSLSIEDFFYHLPQGRIAQNPLGNREDSKLLIYNQGEITEDSFKNLTNFLPEDTLLVFNNSKVIQARLLFKTTNGKIIEVFCLEPAFNQDISLGLSSLEKVIWTCFVGGARKWKEEFIYSEKFDTILKARIIERKVDVFTIELSWEPPSLCFSQVLNMFGEMPIPPYLNRASDVTDKSRYQTTYSASEGSVAAPTAGLHFTQNILEKLKSKNIDSAYVTLHVGAGTFKPVKAKNLREHDMHAEVIDIKTETIEHILKHISQKKVVITVGTTSLRTIETLYWLGVKVFFQPQLKPEELFLNQWEVYESQQPEISSKIALQALLDFLNKHTLSRLLTKTSIMIVPGYRLRIAGALITNFHQPQSTLMLLVAAIVGDDWKKIYKYALENNFRFLSYGDSSLLFQK